MTSKQYLTAYRLLEKRVEAKAEQLQRYRARLTAMTASYSDMPRGGSSKDWTDLSVKCMELEEKVNSEITDLMLRRHNIIQAIESIDNEVYRTVLEMRYLNGWSWTKISRCLNYAESSVYEIHYHALQSIRFPEDANS